MQMNVSLTDHLGTYIQEKVKGGSYNSASEVIREALRLLEERDRVQQAKLDALRADIQEGISSGASTKWDMNELKDKVLKGNQ